MQLPYSQPFCSQRPQKPSVISCEVMFQHGTLRINGTISDMHNGFNGLAAALKDDPISGHIFIF
ncbi:ISEc8 transposase [Klebsiella pneumoniae subsp. rhinoscleromatis]|nr:ISEc8 transposase [Klebsiella pneumoniae subsp. rhinoscleromatis]